MDIGGFIGEQLGIWKVPGCAVAAVKDGEVVLLAGFGEKELGSGSDVTEATLFPIGSTTKAFTAATVGALVDDGLVEWETPVRDYIEDFRMHDPVATERITPRDLLSHSSGLPRHEFAWLGHPERTRADLVRRLRYLPLSADLRQRWQYSNLGYLTVGYLVEAVSGMAWEEFASTRILKPLGMDRTTTSVEALQASEDHSRPHEERDGKVIEIPLRVIDNIGPAGSMNSCAADMARWLTLNLATDETTQVVGSETLRYIHAPQALFPEASAFPEMSTFAYGLGWLVGSYRGRRYVHHSGGVDGFYTEVMLLPEEGIGVFAVSNSLVVLSRVLALRVIDELLAEEPIDWSTRLKERIDAAHKGAEDVKEAAPRIEGASPGRELGEYAGKYHHPGYGEIEIEAAEEGLVPSFGNSSLELAHRHFDVFDLEFKELTMQSISWPLTFLTAPDGAVEAVTVPFEPTLDPIKFQRQPEEPPDPSVLETLAGDYEMGPLSMKVRVEAGKLTATIPGQPPLELTRSRGLKFSVKGAPGASVEFVMQGDAVEKVIVAPGGVFTPAE